MSFNRTIVELKCYLLETETLYVMAFNRTIVELKLDAMDKVQASRILLIVP